MDPSSPGPQIRSAGRIPERPAAPGRPTSPVSRISGVAEVAALSLLLGGATSYAQGVLPGPLSSVANSASGWTLITVLLIWSVRARPVLAAVLGAAGFVLLTLGYTAASSLRGHTYDPTLWSLVGVVVGPFVGVATAWLHQHGIRAALGTAALSGVAIGESVYGLTVVGDSTSPVYWSLIGVAGLALLAGMVARRIRGPVPLTLALGCTWVVAAGFVLAYQALGSAPF